MPHRVIVLTPIGSSDIDPDDPEMTKISGDDYRERGTRALGELLNESYDALDKMLAKPLSIPIIDRIHEWVTAHHAGNEIAYHLAATDQAQHTADGKPNKHWNNDTVTTAGVIARLLRDRHSLTITRGGEVREALGVEHWEAFDGHQREARDPLIVAVNPHDYATQYALWDRRLHELAVGNPTDTELVVCATSGIPAVGWAIMLRGLQHFPDRCTVIYVPRAGRQSDPAQLVPIGRARRREEAARDVPQALAAYQYARARELIVRNYHSCFQDVDLLTMMLDSVIARTEFNFPVARDALAPLAIWKQRRKASATPIAPETTVLVRYLGHQQHELTILGGRKTSQQQQRARLGELYRNTLIQYRLGHYADFLARYIAIRESLVPFMIGLVTGRWFDSSGTLIRWLLQDVRPYVGEQAQLATNIDALPRDARDSDRAFRECYHLVLRDLVASDVPVNFDRDTYRRLESYFRYITSAGVKDLKELRNMCEIAHGFRAVGNNELDSMYGSTQFPAVKHVRGEFDLNEPYLPAPALLSDLAHVLDQVVSLPIPHDELAPLLTGMLLPV